MTRKDDNLVSKSKVYFLIRSLSGLLLAGFLLYSFLLANIRRLSPDFQGLDIICSMPVGIQILMLFVSFVVGVILVIKSFRVISTTVFLVFFLLAILSFYQVKFSYGTNKVETAFGPILLDRMSLSSDIKVFRKKSGFEMVKEDETMYVFTGYGPVGLDRGKVEKELSRLCTCVKIEHGECVEFLINWP